MPVTLSCKQQKLFRLVGGIGSLFCMGLIFFFSAQNGEESSKVSGGLLRLLIRFFAPNLAENQLSGAEFFLRKLAHFSIYFVLAIFLSTFILSFLLRFAQSIAAVTLIGFLYAASDELHQLFIAGRAGSFQDVLLDTCGVFLGSLLTFIIYRYILKKSAVHKT